MDDIQTTDLLHEINDGHFMARALHVVAELGVADVIGDNRCQSRRSPSASARRRILWRG